MIRTWFPSKLRDACPNVTKTLLEIAHVAGKYIVHTFLRQSQIWQLQLQLQLQLMTIKYYTAEG